MVAQRDAAAHRKEGSLFGKMVKHKTKLFAFFCPSQILSERAFAFFFRKDLSMAEHSHMVQTGSNSNWVTLGNNPLCRIAYAANCVSSMIDKISLFPVVSKHPQIHMDRCIPNHTEVQITLLPKKFPYFFALLG